MKNTGLFFLKEWIKSRQQTLWRLWLVAQRPFGNSEPYGTLVLIPPNILCKLLKLQECTPVTCSVIIIATHWLRKMVYIIATSVEISIDKIKDTFWVIKVRIKTYYEVLNWFNRSLKFDQKFCCLFNQLEHSTGRPMWKQNWKKIELTRR